MIGIIATLKVQDGKGRVVGVFTGLAEQVRANEPGNRLYSATKSCADTYKVLAVADRGCADPPRPDRLLPRRRRQDGPCLAGRPTSSCSTWVRPSRLVARAALDPVERGRRSLFRLLRSRHPRRSSTNRATKGPAMPLCRGRSNSPIWPSLASKPKSAKHPRAPARVARHDRPDHRLAGFEFREAKRLNSTSRSSAQSLSGSFVGNERDWPPSNA